MAHPDAAPVRGRSDLEPVPADPLGPRGVMMPHNPGSSAALVEGATFRRAKACRVCERPI
jgi:hypothetical protein